MNMKRYRKVRIAIWKAKLMVQGMNDIMALLVAQEIVSKELKLMNDVINQLKP